MPSDYKAITEYNEDQLGKDTASRKTQVSMYSDSTHFVYEILQNADDHDATEVHFKLSKNELAIEHNGEPFQEKHVRAITYFGKGTSREDLVKTGRFGIGFKSVFAFTATPIIISWPEHFQIYGLYRVREYPYPTDFSNLRTRIILPFNHELENPDFVEMLVSPQEAYQQISECLTKLDTNTLLFTRNIRKISWEICNQSASYWREDEVDDNSRLTIITDGDREKWYLVFSKVPTWENENHKAVEIAFDLDEQHQITSMKDNNLYVLFPTTEKTGLQFLLNGPYRTNPARETISKTDAFNEYLMKVTCELMKELLPKLIQRKILTLQFLAILPNEDDFLSSFYDPFRSTLIDAFQNENLTPTKRGDSFVSAKDLYRSTREMSEVIRDDDLAILLGKDRHLPLWVKNLPLRVRDDRGRFVEDINATKQNKRINDFLDTLDIPKWDVEDLIKALESEDEPIIEWLKQKTDEWHQGFYAFLDDSPYFYENTLSELSIVRCIDGEYRIGSECHFIGDDVELNEDLLTVSTVVDNIDQSELQEEETQEEKFHYVDSAVYSFGNNKNQQDKAHQFLKTIKVSEVNDTERVKAILKQRYKDPFNPCDEDMKKFIAIFKDPENSNAKSIFNDYFVFEIDLQRDNKRWFRKPSEVFLDSPYLDTGLTAYYDAISEDADSFKRALSPNYTNPGSNIDPEELGKFAQAVGAQVKLEVIKRTIPNNDPNLSYLRDEAEGKWISKTGNNEDYIIPDLKVLYGTPSIEKSKLIWRTMLSLPEKCLKAWYWNNNKDKQRGRPPGKSSLVHELKTAKWVPQKDDNSIYFVRPCDSSVEILPKGFPYEPGQEWLKAIEFGMKTKEQKEENTQRNQQAKNLGFDSSEKAEKYAILDQILGQIDISPDDLISQYRTQDNHSNPDFPTSSVSNPDHRRKRVLEQIKNAPKKEHIEKIRNVRETKEDIDQKTTLEEWYTNETDEMLCQICKKEMPFKKTDGKYYFVAMEALTIKFKSDELPESHFFKEDVAQYLALCPECAARFDYFVRTVKGGETVMEKLRNHVINSEDMEFPLKLGKLDTSIRFVESHFHDLKEVLRYYENPHEVEDSTD